MRFLEQWDPASAALLSDRPAYDLSTVVLHGNPSGKKRAVAPLAFAAAAAAADADTAQLRLLLRKRAPRTAVFPRASSAHPGHRAPASRLPPRGPPRPRTALPTPPPPVDSAWLPVHTAADVDVVPEVAVTIPPNLRGPPCEALGVRLAPGGAAIAEVDSAAPAALAGARCGWTLTRVDLAVAIPCRTGGSAAECLGVTLRGDGSGAVVAAQRGGAAERAGLVVRLPRPWTLTSVGHGGGVPAPRALLHTSMAVHSEKDVAAALALIPQGADSRLCHARAIFSPAVSAREYRGRDARGQWWPLSVLGHNPDATVVVRAHDGGGTAGAGTLWPCTALTNIQYRDIAPMTDKKEDVQLQQPPPQEQQPPAQLQQPPPQQQQSTTAPSLEEPATASREQQQLLSPQRLKRPAALTMDSPPQSPTSRTGAEPSLAVPQPEAPAMPEPASATAALEEDHADSPHLTTGLRTSRRRKGVGGFDFFQRALTRAATRGWKGSPPTLDERWRALGAHISRFSEGDDGSVLLAKRLERELSAAGVTGEQVECAVEDLFDALCMRQPVLRRACALVQELRQEMEEAAAEAAEAAARAAASSGAALQAVVQHSPSMRTCRSPRAQRAQKPVAIQQSRSVLTPVISDIVWRWQNVNIRLVFEHWRGTVRASRKIDELEQKNRKYARDVADLPDLRKALERLDYNSRLHQRQNDRVEFDLKCTQKALDETERKREGLENELDAMRTLAARAEEALLDKIQEIKALQSKLSQLDAQYVELQGVVKVAIEDDIEGGSAHEVHLQEQLIDRVEEWALATTTVSSPRAAQQGEDEPKARASDLLVGWINSLVKSAFRPEQAEVYHMDPEEGWTDGWVEVGALFLALHALAPNLVTEQEVSDFLVMVDPIQRAARLLEELEVMGITIAATATQVAASDGRGLPRQQLAAAVLLRVLGQAAAGRAGDVPRFEGPEGPVPISGSPLRVHDTVSRHANSLQCLPVEWEKKRRTAVEMQGRAESARRLVEEAVRNDVLLALRDPEPDSLTVTERRDRAMYINPCFDDPPRFADVTPQDMADCKDAMLANFRYLRRTYKFYSTMESSLMTVDSVMDRKELAALLKDCGLFDSDRPPSIVAGGARRLDRRDFEHLWISATKSAGLSEIPPAKLTELLLRVAHICFAHTKEPLADRVVTLFGNYIIPRAGYLSTAEFRELIYHERCERVLNDHRAQLRKIFVYYAGGEGTGERHTQSRKEAAELSWKEFKQLVIDAKLADDHGVGLLQLQQVFIKMQDDYDAVCNFQEFTEIVCAVAAVRNPAPYLPLHKKVRSFIDELIPPLRKRCKLGSALPVTTPFFAKAMRRPGKQAAGARRKSKGKLKPGPALDNTPPVGDSREEDTPADAGSPTRQDSAAPAGSPSALPRPLSAFLGAFPEDLASPVLSPEAAAFSDTA